MIGVERVLELSNEAIDATERIGDLADWLVAEAVHEDALAVLFHAYSHAIVMSADDVPSVVACAMALGFQTGVLVGKELA